jgi:hypothetical protein
MVKLMVLFIRSEYTGRNNHFWPDSSRTGYFFLHGPYLARFNLFYVIQSH